MHRNLRVASLGAAAVVTLGLGGVFAHAASSTPRAPAVDPDLILPSNSFVTGTTASTIFTVPPSGGITVTCTHNVVIAKTPAVAASTPIALLVLPPTFDDGINTTTFVVSPCKDNIGGTEKTVTKGAWTARFVDNAADTEPNTDSLSITIPIAGAVVTTSQGCTITVAPTAAFTFTATYADGTGKLTVNLSNLPIKVTGGAACPTSATLSKFVGTYTFAGVNRMHDQ